MTSFNGQQALKNPRAELGDKILLIAVALSAVAAMGLAYIYHHSAMAYVITVVLAGIGLLASGAMKGTLTSRMLLTFALTGLVIMHIQLAHGVIEYHFGVFVSLALVMVYLDWRPIVLAAGVYAVHHIVFDRMMAAGFGVYCLPEANFATIILHATYVVIQTGLEVTLVIGMSKAIIEGQELQQLVGKVNQSHGIELNVQDVVTTTELANTLKMALTRMHSAVQTVHSTVANIRMASEEIGQGTKQLSERTESSASGLEQTAASMQELTVTVRQTTDASEQARKMAAENAHVAQQGGEAVNRVVSTMSDINQSSQKINDIIGVIDGIAFQTNILALNAAVEAARAGEQGRGFAVVATEVRSLAQRSATAAKEIKELIGTSVEKVQDGTRLVQSAGETIALVVANAAKVSTLISEISRASAEQSNGIGQINDAIVQLDETTRRNADMVDQSLESAQSLHNQAEELAGAVALFKA
jgi:methyl-accepting chemotaxis protein